MTLLGAISDTHGKLDERIPLVFSEVDIILHAGDFCVPQVFWDLQALGKPVRAVRGNCDTFDDPELPYVARFEIEGVRFVLVHDKWFADAQTSAEADVLVFGHSHMPGVTETAGTLWVNPGSATQPRRSKMGRSVALIDVSGTGAIDARIVALDEL